MSARIERVRARSGNPDADYFRAICPCGWKGAVHSNRTIEGRRLAERDARGHLCMETFPVQRFPIGTRVRLLHDVDRYPHFLVPARSLGTVVHVPGSDPSGTFCVRMDDYVPGAEDWENEIVWSVGDGDDPADDIEAVS